MSSVNPPGPGGEVTGTPVVVTNWVAIRNTAGASIAPAASPPTTTGAGVDTALAFSTQFHHLMLQNNTGAALNWELDSAASAGSPLLASGATLFLDVLGTVLHLFTAAAQPLNGTAGSNIVVRAWN